jgi:RHS repeat-associated protein
VRWTATTQRDVDGEEVDRELPGGARDRWVRDALGRPTQHQVWDGKGVVRDARYGWEVDDRLRFVLDAVTGQRSEYEHDALGRLAAARRNDEAELRLPDALGNLYRAGDRIDRHYGADGRLLRSEERDGARRYEYDDDGRRVRQIDPDGRVWSYRWNRAGRLVAVVRPDGEEVGFGYDALGRRVFKTFQGRTTRWLWDGDVILHEWTEGEPHEESQQAQALEGDETAFVAPAFVSAPTRAPTKQPRGFVPDEDSTGYVEPAFVSRAVQRGGPQLEPAPDGLVTWVSNPDTLAPIAKLTNGRAYSVVCDHLGTPVLMLDERGRSVWAGELSTWGELRLTLGDAEDCPHRFAGQYEDVETGLAYNRYRYFDPQAGQYLCVDPIGLAGGLNSFSYVGDPLTAVDPLGLIDPFDILFTQDSIDEIFRAGDWAGRNIDEAILVTQDKWRLPKGLKLHVMERHDHWVTLRNRTLYVAQKANLVHVDVIIHGVGATNELNKLLQGREPLPYGEQPVVRRKSCK